MLDRGSTQSTNLEAFAVAIIRASTCAQFVRSSASSYALPTRAEILPRPSFIPREFIPSFTRTERADGALASLRELLTIYIYKYIFSLPLHIQYYNASFYLRRSSFEAAAYPHRGSI